MIQKQGHWVPYELKPRDVERRFGTCELLLQRQKRKGFLLSEMALETSTWLNQCFVENILRRLEDDNSIQVTNIFSKPATTKGDNYTSDMIRITTEYSRDQNSYRIKEKKSIIFKILPELGSVIKSGLFHNEMSMMSNTLNKMNKLLEPKYRLSGKILYVQNEDPMFLAIEDLASLGFRMANRLSGLDLDHSILELHGLARFHAASVALCEKEPKQKEMYSKGVDFQLCVYPSSALDLLFFLNTCSSLDVMENKKNILLNEYFSTLLATMKELNCKTPPPTMEELKATMKRKADYGMIIFFVVLPFMLCCKNEAKDLDELWSSY
ncbi:MOS1T transposase, partial [Pseudoatta argentina]